MKAVLAKQWLVRHAMTGTFLFALSCNSFLPGEPPGPGEPIITDTRPPAQVEGDPTQPMEPAQAVNKVVTSENDALSFMMTSLATRCQPIASPGRDIPEVMNKFMSTHELVDDIQMQLWQRLVRNRMIRPVSDPQAPHRYVLSGEIELLGEANDSGKHRFLWGMRLLENTAEGAEVWQDKFEFCK